MNESILTSTKAVLGITEECESFDPQIIMHINTVFATLSQLGVGTKSSFVITDKSAVWNDFLDDNETLVAVKTYVGLKVRIIFDPPVSSTVMDAINRTISELEFRLNIAAEISGSQIDDMGIIIDWGE